MQEITTTVNAELEAKVMQLYQGLKEILSRNDLPPSVRANSTWALAYVSQMVNDLALEYEMLYDLGV